MRPFLVTGCAMSGTKWLSVVLSRLGIPCTHEAAYPYDLSLPRTPLWYGGEVSWCAVPYVHELPEDVPVFRLVRNPLHVARSILATSFLSAKATPANSYVRFHRGPDIYGGTYADQARAGRLRRVERYVAEWDQPVAHLPTFRVEDGAYAADAIARLTNAESYQAYNPEEIADDVGVVHPHGGSRVQLEWEDVPLLAERAVALGYEVE